MGKAIYLTKKLVNSFLEILFPSKCLGCKTPHEILCTDCIKKLPYTERSTEDNMTALYDYRDPVVKNAIWKLKYHHSPYIGEKLGQLLYEELLEEIMNINIFTLGSPIYVIPVPVSYDKKRVRGYNQSEVLAKSFCGCDDKNILVFKNNIVTKKSNTIAQAKITNKKRRIENIKGTFQIKNSIDIKGKTIIIIDDVTTTGATINEMMKILKRSGAKKVVGFTFAH